MDPRTKDTYLYACDQTVCEYAEGGWWKPYKANTCQGGANTLVNTGIAISTMQ